MGGRPKPKEVKKGSQQKMEFMTMFATQKRAPNAKQDEKAQVAVRAGALISHIRTRMQIQIFKDTFSNKHACTHSLL